MIGKISSSYIDLIIFIVLTILVWIKETTVNTGRHNQVTIKLRKQNISLILNIKLKVRHVLFLMSKGFVEEKKIKMDFCHIILRRYSKSSLEKYIFYIFS